MKIIKKINYKGNFYLKRKYLNGKRNGKEYDCIDNI